MIKFEWDRGLRLVAYGTLAALSVVVLTLTRQNRDLSQEVRHLRAESKALQAGSVVPAFSAATLDGDSITVGDVAPGDLQLLFVLTSKCPYCLRTLPTWKSIARQMQQSGSSRVSVVGISLDSVADSTRRYVDDHDIGFPIVRFPDARMAGIYRALGTPITVVIGEKGEVVYGRAGELSDSAAVDSLRAVLDGNSGDPQEPFAPRNRS